MVCMGLKVSCLYLLTSSASFPCSVSIVIIVYPGKVFQSRRIGIVSV